MPNYFYFHVGYILVIFGHSFLLDVRKIMYSVECCRGSDKHLLSVVSRVYMCILDINSVV